MTKNPVSPTTIKTVEEYLKLPYTIEVVRDESDGTVGWFARVLELPGCMTQADTFDEVDEMIQDAMRGWIAAALDKGLPIPAPRADDQYSGKFVIRVPRSLHKELAEAAEHNGVSLNTYVNVALSRVMGQSNSVKQLQIN